MFRFGTPLFASILVEWENADIFKHNAKAADARFDVDRPAGVTGRTILKRVGGRGLFPSGNTRTGGVRKILYVSAVLVLSVIAMPNPADARGCLKGAFIGGVAGHYAGHHGILGAVVGCAIGRHEAGKHGGAASPIVPRQRS